MEPRSLGETDDCRSRAEIVADTHGKLCLGYIYELNSIFARKLKYNNTNCSLVKDAKESKQLTMKNKHSFEKLFLKISIQVNKWIKEEMKTSSCQH